MKIEAHAHLLKEWLRGIREGKTILIREKYLNLAVSEMEQIEKHLLEDKIT